MPIITINLLPQIKLLVTSVLFPTANTIMILSVKATIIFRILCFARVFGSYNLKNKRESDRDWSKVTS
jgi:hypothetical protein